MFTSLNDTFSALIATSSVTIILVSMITDAASVVGAMILISGGCVSLEGGAASGLISIAASKADKVILLPDAPLLKGSCVPLIR